MKNKDKDMRFFADPTLPIEEGLLKYKRNPFIVWDKDGNQYVEITSNLQEFYINQYEKMGMTGGKWWVSFSTFIGAIDYYNRTKVSMLRFKDWTKDDILMFLESYPAFWSEPLEEQHIIDIKMFLRHFKIQKAIKDMCYDLGYNFEETKGYTSVN